MGAKDTSSRQTRNQLKCTTCGQFFRTPDALRSHTAKSHSTVLKATVTNVKTTTASKADIEKIIQQAEKPKRIIRVADSIAIPTTNGAVQVKKILPPEVRAEETSSSEPINYSFKCPKCAIKYPSYITAYRHIQSSHCVNKAGLPVEADSPHLIKPIKFKVCPVCKYESVWNEVHDCNELKLAATPKKPVAEIKTASKTPAPAPAAGYLCSGCNQDFEDLRQFDLHIAHSHTSVQALFFSNYREFTKWKSDMEETTKSNYQMKSKYEEKKYFRCVTLSTFVTHRKKKMQLSCPSVIVLQEYMTGLQVHFYREHARHVYNEYTIPKSLKKHVISNFLKSKDDATVTTSVDADLYVQFKTIMESIIMEAAQLDKAHLRMLQGKALGMTMILNNYILEQGDSDDDLSRNDNGAEVSEIPESDPLEDEKADKAEPVEVKRNVNNVVGKKIVKLINPDDEIQRIEDVRSSQRLKRKGEDSTPVQKVLPTKRSKRSATVSESKRDTTPEQEFLQVTTDVTIEAAPKTANDKKSEAKTSTPKPKGLKKQTDLEKAIDESNSSPSITKKTEWFPKSPSFSFADQYKDFVKKNFATSTVKVDKKNKKIRTKLGQFKPSLSPKQRSKSIDSPSPKKTSSESSSPATRVAKTERNKVKEQANDSDVSSPLATRAAKVERHKVKEQEVSSSPATRVAKIARHKGKEEEIPSSPAPRAAKLGKHKGKEEEISSSPVTKAAKTEKHRVKELENDSSISSSPATKAAKIERYEVKEQENDCNILILKI